VPDEDDATLRDAHWKMYLENCTLIAPSRDATIGGSICIHNQRGCSHWHHHLGQGADAFGPAACALLPVVRGTFGADFSAKQYGAYTATHAARTGLSRRV
jgi:hypothetical protein